MLKDLGKKAKVASKQLALASTDQKNGVLEKIISAIQKNEKNILEANQQDLKEAKEAGLEAAMQDRLSLQERLKGIINDIQHVQNLPDPIGEEFDASVLPNGIKLCKRRVPLGVIGVIYEARPNVTLDVAALTLKTGNCAILRGGSETIRSNQALVLAIHEALTSSGLPKDAIQLIESKERTLVKELLELHEYVDLIIPRGGASLHQFCRENSRIPVITGGIGICHLFVDATADLNKSVEVIVNAKTQRPTVCNALDTLLVHQQIAPQFLPMVVDALAKKQVQFRLDVNAEKLLKNHPASSFFTPAKKGDWDTEWLSLILGIKVVANLDEAIVHIQNHSSFHSDGILTEDKQNAERFLREIDSAAVYVNASTRFTDGGQFGLGAEVSVSTQKIHARGPMGLKELTSYKWIAQGNYQVRT